MDSSKFVTSEDGTKIWADAVGDPSKPSVMFIPVTSSSTLIFGKRFEDFKLTKHLRLVHYGIRKQGLSNQPLDPSAWTSNKFEDFKAVVEAYRLKKPFIAPWSAGGAFRGWNTGIINPWLAGVFPRFLSPELSNLCSTARDFTEVFTFYPDKIRPAIKFAWIGACTSQHPVARMNYITRTQDGDAPKGAVGKVPVLALLMKGEKLYKEAFVGFVL